MHKCKKCLILYVNSCPKCRSEYQKKYRLLNHERTKELSKIHSKKYRENNKEKVKKVIREWVKRNREKVSRYQSAWEKRDPSRKRAKRHNRRARLKNCGGTVSANRYDKLIILQRNKCACCKIDFKKIKADMDHILPLALGGRNDDSNIQLLCKKCNNEKYIKHPIDFMQSRGYLL